MSIADAPEILTLIHDRLDCGLHVYTTVEMVGFHYAHRDDAAARKTLPRIAAEIVRRQYGAEIAYRFSENGRRLIAIERADVN